MIAISLPWPDRVCSIPDCCRPHYGRGLCSAHYDRLRRHGDPLRGGPVKWLAPICRMDGCQSVVAADGLCNAHYKRQRRHGDPSAGGTPLGEPMSFLESAVFGFKGSNCLGWPYTRDGNGYGRVSYNGNMVGAHRIVCEVVHGPAPSSLHEVAHSCGKGHEGCVNPSHLRWATRSENHADKLKHGTHQRGQRHPQAKITDADARLIRALRGVMPGREIARRFNVSPATICNIQKGDTWSWL